MIFIISSAFIVLARPLLAGWNADFLVLLGGNVILFAVTAVSWLLYVRGLRDPNIRAFLNRMYGSLLVKLFVCMVAALVYGYVAGRGMNRNGILGCFVLYILYSWLEVRILLQLTRNPPEADCPKDRP